MANNDLAQLAALAQVYGTLSKPQQDQESEDRVNAIRMLELQQRGRAQDSEDTYRQQALQQAREEATQRTRSNYVSSLIDRGATMEQLYPLIKGDPVIGEGARAQHDIGVANASRSMEPAIRAVYGAASKDHDYAKLKLALSALNTNPEAFAGAVPWGQMNATLGHEDSVGIPEIPKDLLPQLAALNIQQKAVTERRAHDDEIAQQQAKRMDAVKYLYQKNATLNPPKYINSTFGPVFQ